MSVGQGLFTLSFPDNTLQASLRVDFLYENKDTLEMDHELQVGDVLGVASDLFEIETRSGRHHLDGFFLLAGAGIEEGKQLEHLGAVLAQRAADGEAVKGERAQVLGALLPQGLVDATMDHGVHGLQVAFIERGGQHHEGAAAVERLPAHRVRDSAHRAAHALQAGAHPLRLRAARERHRPGHRARGAGAGDMSDDIRAAGVQGTDEDRREERKELAAVGEEKGGGRQGENNVFAAFITLYEFQRHATRSSTDKEDCGRSFKATKCDPKRMSRFIYLPFYPTH